MPQIAGFRGALRDQPADAGRCIYRYHQLFAGPGRTFTRKNLILAVRLSPWSEGIIRPHEASVPAARDAALARIRTAGAHAEPVVMGFRDQPEEVERLLRKTEGGKPTLEATTPDGTVHRVWRVQDAELLGKLRHYFAPKKLNVLEGHDRYEAMLAYHAELAGKAPLAMYSSANYGLACLVNLDDPTLVTAPRHRILRGTIESPGSAGARSDAERRGGVIESPGSAGARSDAQRRGGLIDREAALASARAHFIVDKLPGAAKDVGALVKALGETVAHQPAFVVVFAGAPDAWKLTLSPEVSAFSEGVAPHRALQKLDPVVADGLFVARALPGTAATTDTDATRALAALDSGAGAVLIMRPLSVEQIAHVAELGQLLPPGSTAFHPAIASGLVSLRIDPDEDLV